MWRSGDFLSLESHCKPVFLVDSIIELCVNVQEISDFVVAVLSPNKKFLSSVFIYGKSVRRNDEILFLNRSGEQGSVIGLLKEGAMLRLFVLFFLSAALHIPLCSVRFPLRT